MKIQAITNIAKKIANNRTIARAALKFKRYWPEISLALGIGSSVGATVTTAVQTRKLDPILEEHEKKMADIRKMPKGDKRTKAMLKVYAVTLKDIAKLYIVPAALEVGSAAFLISGHHALRKENARIMAAYICISEAYKRTLDKIKKIEGEDKYLEYMAEEVVEKESVNENGETVKEKYVVMNDKLSVYARLFDCGNKNWSKNPVDNLAFLRSQMVKANAALHAKGYLFLNEVYDLLDIPRSEAGQFVGWVEGAGDDFVDFGMFNVANKNAIDEFEPAIWLDFNVDGSIMYIFDKMHGGDGKNANYMVCK